MCTAVVYRNGKTYCGRNLDNSCSYGEEIVVMPRNFPLRFRHSDEMKHHHAIVGTASVMKGVPLYYDAMNEEGVWAAGLNFVGNAIYSKASGASGEVAHFEFIPWILSQCSDIEQVRGLLKKLTIVDTPFDTDVPPAQLHWIVADRSGASITVESVADGLRVYDNPAGVLTNNPPFPMQLSGLGRYMALSSKEPENLMAPRIPLSSSSYGTGAIGLPGDLSSESRFVRAVFVKENSAVTDPEEESIGQFFHILDSVAFPQGCCDLGNGLYEKTIYSSCCSLENGIYYYTTYENRQITAVDMSREDMENTQLARFAMERKQRIFFRN